MLQIRWEHRHKGGAPYENNVAKVTVDGTDFRIEDPFPKDPGWYTRKFNGPGVRYEVGVCIGTGDIVAFNGPFMPGVNQDISIFRYKMKNMLEPEEKVVADKGYRGDLKVLTPLDARDLLHKRAMSLARVRHETVNRRFKQWSILSQRYRHSLNQHSMVFRSILVLTQLSFNTGNPPWQIKENIFDDPMLI